MNHQIAPLEKLHRALNPQPPVNLFELGYVAPLSTDFAKPAAPEIPDDASAEAADESLDEPIIETPRTDMSARVAKLLSPLFDHLQLLKPESELRQRLAVTKLELGDFGDKLASLLSEIRDHHVTALQQQQAEAATACREQQKAVDRASQAISDYQSTVRKANAMVSGAKIRFKDTLAREPQDGSWPTAQEKARWRVERDRAQKKIEAAELEQGNVFAEDRRLRQTHNTELQKLNELAKVERVLRLRLNGKPYRDIEYGLMNEPDAEL